MRTLTSLANNALAQIAERPVGNILTDDTEHARRVLRAVRDGIERAQNEFPWRELVQWSSRSTLAREAEDSADGMPRYRLPEGFLALVRPIRFDYRLEGRHFLTAEGDFAFRWVRYSEDIGAWSEPLRRAAMFAIAATLAPALSQKFDLGDRMEAYYQQALDKARVRQARENRPQSYLPRDGGDYLRGHSW